MSTGRSESKVPRYDVRYVFRLNVYGRLQALEQLGQTPLGKVKIGTSYKKLFLITFFFYLGQAYLSVYDVGTQLSIQLYGRWLTLRYHISRVQTEGARDMIFNKKNPCKLIYIFVISINKPMFSDHRMCKTTHLNQFWDLLSRLSTLLPLVQLHFTKCGSITS